MPRAQILALVLVACDPDPGKLTAAECASPEVALFGVNIDPANPASAPTAAAVHELGARWVRFAYKAEKGMLFHQQRIEEYRSAGIKVLLNVSYEAIRLRKPPHDATAAEWQTYGAAFQWAVTSIAAGIGSRVDAYEVWNEPDQEPSPGYDPGVPPDVFGPMADKAGRVLAATGVPVLLGGFSSGQPRFVTDTIAAGGGLAEFTGIAIHPYGADWLPGNKLEGHFTDFAIGGRSVWLSEIGIEADPAAAASYLEHVYQTTLDGGYAGAAVPVIFWFAWSDGNSPGFGLMDVEGKPKATYTAYQDLAPAAHGRCTGGGIPNATDTGGCGDGVCQGSETVESCGIDCGCAAPGACGTIAPFGCYCDATCGERGDCCSDYAAACGG